MRKVILLVQCTRESERDLLRGIMKFSQAQGFWTLYQEPPGFFKALPLRSRIKRMRAWGAHGVIATQDRLTEVRALKIPNVVTEYENPLPSRQYQIVADNRAIGKMAAEHLLGLGFSHFAFCGLADRHWSNERRDGFAETIARCGGEPMAYALETAPSGASWYSMRGRIERWLTTLPSPVGLMTCNDDLAVLLAEVCHNAGIKVPDEVALIGVDNDDLICNGATPPLSSVALATQRAGYEAAEMLDHIMAGRTVGCRRIAIRPTHIVSRQSTDLIAVSDPNLAKAIRFIRENVQRPIKVQDVAAAAGLCTRTLQHRFGKLVGQSVLQEIASTRIRHINRLLSETNLSVAEIAQAMGYPADAHIARFFKRYTGLTPLAYRRKHKPT
ncbi:MAG: DNA-binding transcriptional regulator [Lentisphaerae bacterium]|nr:DNA-binding transcriptional regulator [Lentisphaerota bacterium]